MLFSLDFEQYICFINENLLKFLVCEMLCMKSAFAKPLIHFMQFKGLIHS